MKIAVLIFDELTPLDAIGPVEVLSRVPGAEIVIVGLSKQPVRDSRTHWMLQPEARFDEVVAPDVVLLPGGPGVDAVISNEGFMAWLRASHETSDWTTSVCTGALVLAAAGLLRGRRATTHWQSREELASYGVEVLSERVVRDGKVVTSAGVSAGIDMAFVLAAAIAGDEIAGRISRAIEYEIREGSSLDRASAPPGRLREPS